MTSTSSSSKRSSREAGPAARGAAPLYPRKSLGQHFLTDERILKRIAGAAELSRHDTVIEIGAGTGALTAELAARAGRVVALELDERLCAQLAQRFRGTNVSIVQGDALEFDPASALEATDESGRYVIAGNLPYYIAQPLLRHFLEAKPPPQRMIVMLQAEVAKSIAAQPGQMSMLSVSVQLYGEPRILFHVPPSAFRPPPKVRSAVVRIDVPGTLRAPVADSEAFFQVVRAGFSARRKQLRNGLANGLRIDPAKAAALLADAEIDPTLRPQMLPLAAWAGLADAWIAAGKPEGRR